MMFPNKATPHRNPESKESFPQNSSDSTIDMTSPNRTCQSSATVTPGGRLGLKPDAGSHQPDNEDMVHKQALENIPFSEISENDVLCGRGAGTNRHVGNKKFRKLVQVNHEAYFNAKVLDKSSIAARIVEAIRMQSPPGRFLKASEHSNEGPNKNETCWYEIGDRAAKDKTSQALRERTPEDRRRQDVHLHNCSTPSLESGSQFDSHTNSPVQLASQAHEFLQLPLLNHGEERTPSNVDSATARNNDEITDNDVLCGRGGVTNCHAGNRRFRELVKAHQPSYLSAPKMEKAKIAKRIVAMIRQAHPSGRFLQQSKEDGTWNDIGDLKAREKASQALREKAPEARIVFSAAADLMKTKEGRSASSDRKWPALPESVQERDAAVDRDDCPQQRARPVSPHRRFHRSQQSSYDDDVRTYSSTPSAVEIERSPSFVPPPSSSNHYHPRTYIHPNSPYGAQESSFHADPAYQDFRYSTPEYYSRDPARRISTHELNEYDVLLGRGAGVNFHPGNLRFRDIVQQHRVVYCQAQKLEKSSIAQYIVDQVRRQSGRFLIKDTDDDDLWIEVDEDRAREKTSQALREKLSDSPKRKCEARPRFLYRNYFPEEHAYPSGALPPPHSPHYSYVPPHEIHHGWGHHAPSPYPSEPSSPHHYGGYYPKRRRIHNETM